MGEGGGRPQRVQEMARLQIRGTVRGGASHVKHVAHGCDAGRRVESQRLVEHRRKLPRDQKRERNTARCRSQKGAGADGFASTAQRGGSECRSGAGHVRSAP
eukprot:scaffold80909_cov62-Phaeocystis_antarctica.AAC.12